MEKTLENAKVPAETPEEALNRVFTIPNLLSFFRLCLIPVFIWLYCKKEDYAATAIVLIVSGITDIVDGFIARRFHMVSNLGKALDPVADKLTQAAMLFCLLTRFPMMWLPFALLVVKEIFCGVTGLLVIKKQGKVYGAEWHGKVMTCLLDTMLVVHVFWYDIPAVASNIFVVACAVMMIVSFVLYGRRNLRMLGH